VLCCLIVVKLGRHSQSLKRLGTRVDELTGSLGDLLFQPLRRVGELALDFMLRPEVVRRSAAAPVDEQPTSTPRIANATPRLR